MSEISLCVVQLGLKICIQMALHAYTPLADLDAKDRSNKDRVDAGWKTIHLILMWSVPVRLLCKNIFSTSC